jgi:hypothetical protein
MNNIGFDKKLEACKVIPDTQSIAKTDCVNSLIEVPTQHTSNLPLELLLIFCGALMAIAVFCFIMNRSRG